MLRSEAALLRHFQNVMLSGLSKSEICESPIGVDFWFCATPMCTRSRLLIDTRNIRNSRDCRSFAIGALFTHRIISIFPQRERRDEAFGPLLFLSIAIEVVSQNPPLPVSPLLGGQQDTPEHRIWNCPCPSALSSASAWKFNSRLAKGLW